MYLGYFISLELDFKLLERWAHSSSEGSFTCHTIHLLKLIQWFSVFIELRNHHYNFYHQKKPYTYQHFLPTPIAPANHSIITIFLYGFA